MRLKHPYKLYPPHNQTIIVEYEEQLNKLQPPLPAPKRCNQYFCDTKPQCYTSFMPHHSPNYTLAELLVGKNNWTVDGFGIVGHGEYYASLEYIVCVFVCLCVCVENEVQYILYSICQGALLNHQLLTYSTRYHSIYSLLQ
jgi:hypothetical protein